MSYILLSHHLILSLHSSYTKKSDLQAIVSERENQSLRKLMIKDRKELSNYIQNLISEVFKNTENYFYSLSLKEVFMVLKLSNKFLEICFEFSSQNESKLLEDFFSLMKWYSSDFSTTNFE